MSIYVKRGDPPPALTPEQAAAEQRVMDIVRQIGALNYTADGLDRLLDATLNEAPHLANKVAAELGEVIAETEWLRKWQLT